MALIQCPECGREISDRVTSCPHCGYPFSEQPVQPVTPQPVEVTGINLSIKKNEKYRTLFIGIFVLALLIAIVIISIMAQRSRDAKNARNDYIDDLASIRSVMLSGAADAEKLCNLTHDVWYNTIYEEFDIDTDPFTRNDTGFNDDFNDSLSALYSDESTKTKISEIESNRYSVDAIMKKLLNPTGEFSACYDTLDALYDAYCGLTNLATSPSGSLTSFTESYREYDNDFVKYYEKLGNQIPEKE